MPDRPFTEALSEFLVQALRVAVNPRRFLFLGKMHQFRMGRCPGLQAVGQAGLLPDKILHEAQHGSTQGIVMLLPFQLGGSCHAGATHFPMPFQQGNLPALLLGQIGSHQTVDAGANDDHAS